MAEELPRPLERHPYRRPSGPDQKGVSVSVDPITIVLMDFKAWAQDWRDADKIQKQQRKK